MDGNEGQGLHDLFEAMVRDKTGGLLMTNVSVTDPDGGFHCACTHINIGHSAVYAAIAKNLKEAGVEDTGGLESLATEEDNFFIASVSSDVHVMKDKAVSNLRTPFSAKVTGIELDCDDEGNPRIEGIQAFMGALQDAAAWIGIKFHGVADEVQLVNEAARREGQSAASALAGVKATFMADARVDGWMRGAGQ